MSTAPQPTTTTPALDPQAARPVEPRRHDDGRTIAWEQPAAGNPPVIHLFSATGVHLGSRPAPKAK